MAFETYRSSGRMGPLAIPLAVVAGAVAAGAGSWIYQLIVDKVPFIYLNFIATAGFGALVGAAVGYGGKQGKCRSVPMAIALAVIFGIGGTLLSYKFSYDRRLESESADVRDKLGSGGAETLIEAYIAEEKPSPIEAKFLRAGVKSRGDVGEFKKRFGIGDYLSLRAEEGWALGRSGKGLPMTGILVYLVWLAELVVVAGLGGFVAQTMVDVPFCEELDCWMPAETVARVKSVDAGALRTAARNGDAGALLDPHGKERGRIDAEYTAHTCEGADHCYLSVKLKWKEKNGKKLEDKSENLVRYAKFAPADLEKLQANLSAT